MHKEKKYTKNERCTAIAEAKSLCRAQNKDYKMMHSE
jgi:hypothetical protein